MASAHLDSSLTAWACFFSIHSPELIFLRGKIYIFYKYLGEVQKWSERVPAPVSILGTDSDSLATLDKKEVTFIPLTSFYFSEPRVTSNTVSDKMSPSPRAWMSPPEISRPAPPAFDRFQQTYFRLKPPTRNRTWDCSVD